MSHEKEPEKLTPDSGNSYDGSGTHMNENDHEFDAPENPKDGEPEEAKQAKEKEEDDERRKKRQAHEAEIDGVKGFLRALVLPIDKERTEEQKDAIAKAFVDFISAETSPKDQSRAEHEQSEAQVQNIARWLFLVSTEVTTEGITERNQEVFDGLLDAVDEAGFDRDIIEQEVDHIADEKVHFESEEDRIEEIDKYLEKRVKNATDEALEQLKENIAALADLGEEGSLTEDYATKSESLLDKILEDVEVHTDDAEKDAYDRWCIEYAEMLHRVVDAMPDVPQAEEEALVEEQQKQEEKKKEHVELTESEKEQIQLLMKIVLTGSDPEKDSNGAKENRVAAVLAEYAPLNGDTDDEFGTNKAVRDEILRIAEAAGLDTNAIEINEISEETDTVNVNDLESVLEGNSFEELIAKQILNIDPEDVQKIKATWEELLTKVDPESDIAETAREAIDVLGDIIHFRFEQRKAHARGEQMDRRLFTVPELLRGEGSEQKEDTDEQLVSDDKAKEKLIKTLIAMFTSADPLNNEASKQIINDVTKLVIVTAGNFEEQAARLSILISCIPDINKKRLEAATASAIAGQINTVAMSFGIVNVAAHKGITSVSDRKKNLEKLFRDSLDVVTTKPITEIHDAWKSLLTEPELDADFRADVKEAVTQMEILAPQKKAMSRTDAIEIEVNKTKQFTDDIIKLFIDEPELMKGHEEEIVNALVHTVLAKHQMANWEFEPVMAEQAIAKLLHAFPGEGESAVAAKSAHVIRSLIIKRAIDLKLDPDKILNAYDVTELTEGEPAPIFSKQDQLRRVVKDSLDFEKIDADQLRFVKKSWDTVAAQMGERKEELRNLAQNAGNNLGDLADAQEALARTAPGDPTTIFEQENEVQEEQRTQQQSNHPIITLEQGIESVKNEELQSYLRDLVTRMKAGMSPDEVSNEQKALQRKLGEISRTILGQSRQRDAKKTETMRDIEKLTNAVKPFKDYLSTGEDGIAAFASVGELPYHTEKILRLASKIEGADNKDLREYLEKLEKQYKTGTMTPQQLEEAFETFNKHLSAFTKDARKNIEAKTRDSRRVNVDAEELILFEGVATQLRNLLQQQAQQGAADVVPGDLTERQQKQVDSFLVKTKSALDQQSFDKFTNSKLEAYIEGLDAILAIPGALDNKQIEDIYRALHIQNSILESRASKKGELFAFIETNQKAQIAKARLYGLLVKTSADETKAKEINDTVLELVNAYTDQPAHTAASRGQMVTRVPVKVPDPYSRSMDTKYMGDDTATALEYAAQVWEQSLPPVTSTTSPSDRDVYQQFSRDAIDAKATSDTELEASVNELNKMIQDAILNNKSEGIVSIRNLAPARNLARAMLQQRNELAKLRGYEGLILQRSDRDKAIYDGYIHEVLGERMRRIRVYYGEEPAKRKESGEMEKYTAEEIQRYYRELQRWTRILLKNDVRKRPEDASNPDVLRLENSRFERFSKIAATIVKDDFDIQTKKDEILEQIDYMRDPSQGNFLRYFKQNAPDPEKRGQLLGVPYQRPVDMGPYAPESLEATMNMIAKEFGSEFQTGGEHELITAEGEFMYQNFVYWIRRKINEDVDYNKDGGINPFGKIIIKLDMGQISMYELLLLIPEYTSQRDFVIRMDSKDGKKVYSGWGEKKESEELKWDELDLIAAEMEFRQMTHDIRKDFTATSVSNNKEQYLNLMKKLHHANHWTRASNVFLWLGIPSAAKGREEMSDWIRKEKQGSLGKALSDMLVAYYYLSEMTDFHEKSKDVSKNFNENMFYRFLEPDGANRMLISMAEGALGYNKSAKEGYSQFIGERVQAAANRYKRDNPSLDAEKRGLLDQLVEEYTPKKGDTSHEVSFTESEQLLQFLRLVETNVLNKRLNKKSEKALKDRVKIDLVTNLRKGYFNKLKEMTVMKVAEKDDKARRDEKSSNRILKTDEKQPRIRFGSIVIDKKGTTMAELLDSFDEDQILLFDFVGSDPNDPNNPFRAYLGKEHKDILRFKIDEFMDPTRHKRHHDLFKKNEKLMLNFTKHITRIHRKDLNHFRDADELEFARDIVKRGMMKTMEKTYGIDSHESMYAWWWARDYIYLWGIGAYLDVDGIGFRWDGKIMNPGRWRPRRQGKDGGGNAHTFDEFRVFCLPFLHHMRVSNIEEHEPLGARSIFYWMQGGDGGYITPRAVREFDVRSNYTFQQNAEALYVDNTLDNSSELLDLLSKTEFDVSNIVSFDVLGNVVFDYGKAREVFGKWRKAARYAFGKNGLDYREKIWANGRERMLYEYFFGPKTRALNELIFRNTERSLDFMYKDPADAVMMSIIAAEVYEHRAMFSPAHHWSIQNVLELEKFLLDFLTEFDVKEKEDGDQESHAKDKPTLFSSKIFRAALKAYHTSYAKMYTTELGSTLGAGALRGLWAFMKAYFTKGKWIY